jgi:hypothetical protein
VPDSQTAISTLASVADAFRKRSLKEQYFERQREKYFLPNAQGIIPSSSLPAAECHVAEALRMWADRFELPPGEASVMMNLLGTLGTIATADDEALSGIPIDDRSKRLLHIFFGSHGHTEAPLLESAAPSAAIPHTVTAYPQTQTQQQRTPFVLRDPNEVPFYSQRQPAHHPSTGGEGCYYPMQQPSLLHHPQQEASQNNCYMPPQSQPHYYYAQEMPPHSNPHHHVQSGAAAMGSAAPRSMPRSNQQYYHPVAAPPYPTQPPPSFQQGHHQQQQHPSSVRGHMPPPPSGGAPFQHHHPSMLRRY